MTTQTQLAERQDEATELLASGITPPGVVRILMARHGVSRATAYRIVHAAVAAAPAPDPDLEERIHNATDAIAMARHLMLDAMARNDVETAAKWQKLYGSLCKMTGFSLRQE